MIELLSDPERCQVLLVTIPEETPVSELVDTAFAIEDRTGVCLGPGRRERLLRRPRGRASTTANGSTRRRRSRGVQHDAELLDVFVSDREARDLAARRGVPRRARRDPAPPGRPARRSASRCRRSGCRSCSPRTSGSTEIEHLADAFTAGVEGAVTRGSVGRGRRAGPRRRLLRQRRRRQDHDRRGARDGGRAARPARASSSPSTRPSGSPTRSGSTSCRTSRARSRPTRWDPKGERVAGRRALRDDARHEVDVRRARHALRGVAGADAADPRELLLPEHLLRALGHAGVHGDGEAARAATRKAASTSSSSTPRRAGTRSTSSTRRSGCSACSTTASSGC